MGSSHNQDHYKVSGSDIENRGITRRDRRRLGMDNARLQKKAGIPKTPPAGAPRTSARKPKAAPKPRRKAPQNAAASEKPPIVAQVEKATSRPRSRPAATRRPEAPPSAEVVSLRRQRAARTHSVAPPVSEATPGVLGQAMRTLSASGRLARRTLAFAVDVATAPWTIARLVRQSRQTPR